MDKADLNEVVTEPPSYMVLKIDHNRKIILPFDKGVEFMRLWASGVELVESWRDDPTLKKMDADLEVSFLTEQKFNEMKMSMLLETDDAK